MTLALELGWTPGDVLRRLSGRAIAEMGRVLAAREEAAELRAGVVCSVIANLLAVRRPGQPPFQPSDFFTSLTPAGPDPAQVEANVRAWEAMILATVEKVDK